MGSTPVIRKRKNGEQRRIYCIDLEQWTELASLDEAKDFIKYE
jgi:hypothetical protein